MQEIRYTGKPTPMMLIALVLLIYLVWYVYHLIYSLFVFNPPTTKTIIELLVWLAVFGYTIVEIAYWLRCRNTVAFRFGPEIMWTKKAGWRSHHSVDLKVDKWRDVVSIAYDNPNGIHLEKWRLSELTVRSDEIVAIRKRITGS